MLISFFTFLENSFNNELILDIIHYFIRIRNNAVWGDYVFLTIGTFIVHYLLMFRYRLHTQYSDEKNKHKNKKALNTKELSEENNMVLWFYMVKNKTMLNYKAKHPKSFKLLFAYNAFFVTFYIIEGLLLPLSLLFSQLRDMFIDIEFINLYTNISFITIHSFIWFINKRLKSSED